MKFFIKLTATFFLLIASFGALAYFLWYKPKFADKHVLFTVSIKENDKKEYEHLQQKAAAIAQYATKHSYNNNYCFLIDMKITSGKKRFFVYNLKNDSIELAGLVAHGSGKNNTGNIQFSNVPNSLCTSLGKYKIGNAYTGKFGSAFKLYGLDSTNSNALNRFVVLHSHSCVPNEETFPVPICESWGCPTVAPAFLNELKKYIATSEKPMLLEIYY